jgi:hypothetical protein
MKLFTPDFLGLPIGLLSTGCQPLKPYLDSIQKICLSVCLSVFVFCLSVCLNSLVMIDLSRTLIAIRIAQGLYLIILRMRDLLYYQLITKTVHEIIFRNLLRY